MKILAADTATSINTVAVCDGDTVLAETIVNCHRAHAERLIGTIDWVLSEAGVPLSDLDALAISVGPGSFTGLRVGVALWKGLALANDLPLVGVPTLDALAATVAACDAPIVPLLDARMSEVFAAVYERNGKEFRKLTPDMVAPIEQVLSRVEGPALFLGDGAERYAARIHEIHRSATVLSASHSIPRASAVAGEALRLLNAGDPGAAESIEPVYLRRSQAEEARGAAS